MGEHSQEADERSTPPPGVVVLPGYLSARDPSRALRVGPHGMPREHVEQVQRDRLIDAFVQVVAERGYESAGIKVICKRAGVAFNTFYELFESKEQLFLAAYERGVAILFHEARAASLTGEMTWEERVRAGLEVILRTLAHNPDYAKFHAIEIHKAGAEAQERVDETFESAFRLFDNSPVASVVGMPTEHLGPLVIGGIYTRMYFYIRIGRTADLPELLPVLTRFVLTAFTLRDDR